VPIIGELELGWRATEADTIAITGTNGKTTTTALTGSVLALQPRPVLVAGNIGTPLAADALTFPPDGLVVCEVSSFQLETTELFQPRVAVVLNLTPDHLDRHGTFEAYVNAKARIFAKPDAGRLRRAECDDAPTRALASRTTAPVVWFSRRRELSHGVFVRDGRIAAKLNGHVEEICPSRRSSCAASTTWRTSWPRPRAPSGPASRPRRSARPSAVSAGSLTGSSGSAISPG